MISALMLLVSYRILAKLPFFARKKFISMILSVDFFNRRKKIRGNIRLLRPDLDENKINDGVKRLKKTMTENYATLLGSKRLNFDKEFERLEVTGDIEKIIELYKKGEKLVIVTPHTGPYDVSLLLFARWVERRVAPLPLRIFIPAENIPLVDIITNDLRKVAGENIHFERIEKGKILLQAAEHLNKGYIVVFGFDMIRKKNRGVPCRLGAAEAVFPAGWASLALREDANVIPFLSSSGENRKIKINVGAPFKIEETGDMGQDIQNGVRRLVGQYEVFFLNHYYDWLQLQSSDLVPMK